ncbi:MAG: CARDB domain-containing protein [Acidobacteriota bacterium]
MGIKSRPDLVTESISVPGAPLYAGETYPFFAHVGNLGAGRASGTFQQRLRIDGASEVPKSCSDLDPGSTCTLRWDISMTSGNHTIEVCADDGGQVAEQSEGNNCRVVDVSVQDRPDLRVSSFSLAPSGPEVGEDIQVMVTVRNSDQGASGGFEVALDVPGDDPPRQTCPSLGHQQTCTRTFAWIPVAAGRITLLAIADPANAVVETNEGNNRQPWQIEVTEPARGELYFPVDGISIYPPDPQVGDILTFTFRMRNSGADLFGSPAPQMSVNGSGVDWVFACTEGIPNAGDCVRTVTVPAPSTPGTHAVTATADPFSQIPEGDEANNTRTLYYVVADPSLNVTCQGTWYLDGLSSSGQTHSASSQGSVVDDCSVFFAQNQPMGCMATFGTGGLTAVWHRNGPDTCPHRVTFTEPGPGGEVWNYTVTIY